MTRKTYVFEVVKFVFYDDLDNYKKIGSKFLHQGYMKAKFKSKNDAASYYNRNNPHMRPINSNNNYRSDWDPETKLLYIIRDDRYIIDTIDTFKPEDMPTIVNGKRKYKWLK